MLEVISYWIFVTMWTFVYLFGPYVITLFFIAQYINYLYAESNLSPWGRKPGDELWHKLTCKADQAHDGVYFWVGTVLSFGALFFTFIGLLDADVDDHLSYDEVKEKYGEAFGNPSFLEDMGFTDGVIYWINWSSTWLADKLSWVVVVLVFGVIAHLVLLKGARSYGWIKNRLDP